MRKFVYLFELDSVRKTDVEIIKGQCALYNEIVKNGNIVVLTYNQLIDSRAFFSLLQNKDYYASIIKLFKKGYICISQFGTTRTIAQYLLNTIDSEENKFIYSVLPIKRSQRRLIELIKRSVIYSDLSEINEYNQLIGRTNEDLRDLFVEVDINANNGNNELVERQSELSMEEMHRILENLYGLLGMVLRLSTIHDIFISPRDPSEYAEYKLSDFLKYVSSITMEPNINSLWNSAIDILKNLSCWGTNNRSIYLREIKEKSEVASNIQPFQYADAIVSICTNYAYEMSICNISKHYNTEDIKKTPTIESSFFKDFLARLEQDWNSGNEANNRFLQGDTSEFIQFTKISEIPSFEEVADFIPEVEENEVEETIHRYEYRIKNQRRTQNLSILKKVPRQIGSFLIFGLLSMLLNVIFEVFHNVSVGEFSLFISWSAFFSFGMEAIVFFIFGEFVTTFISKRFPNFLSLSEACQGLVKVLKAVFHLLFRKANTYISEIGVECTEKKSKSNPIDFLESTELNKYLNQYKENKLDLFSASSVYPIADVSNKEIRKAILRNQELYKVKYGVVYNSQYNSMIVDPIMEGKRIISYERVVPSASNNGVVLLTLYKGNFVLLRQFRHAIRKEQLCFPRGFGELGISTIENAKKELKEELNAVVSEEPIKLGIIYADSGIFSGRATVFLMKIDEYSYQNKEGIRDVVEIAPDEMNNLIKKGEIDDAYTLASLTLYSMQIKDNM